MTADGPRAVRRQRRMRWVGVGVVLVVVLGVGTGVVLTRRTGTPAAAAAQGPSPVKTAEVTKSDLTERRSETGKLGYGSEHTLSGRKPGTITALPAEGAVLDRGATVYQVDAKPVPLFLGAIPLYRDLSTGMTDGPDVQVVEENLKALGYTGFGTPNQKFTAATATAIKKWQKALGLEQTGVLGMADVVVTPGPIRVGTVSADLGSQGNGSLLTWTGTGRAVTVELTASDKDLAKIGAKVALAMGAASTTGTVTGVAPSDDSGDNQNQRPGETTEQKFTVTIVPDDQAAFGEQDAGSVDVRLTTGSRQGVLTVPVGALLALAEGGYAVEVVDGTNRHLVAVKTGLFADGKVEVQSTELKPGTKVVTTA